MASALGSSGSQMIAVFLPRFFRWRSMQLYETLVSPSSNHLIETLPSKEVFLTLLKGLNQSMRLPCLPQNLSGFLMLSAYHFR